MALPAELRNEVYQWYFHDFFYHLHHDPDPLGAHMHYDVFVLKQILPILSVSKTVHREAASILWMDYIPACHYNFGAGRHDAARFHSFIKAMRVWTRSVGVTYQERRLNTTALDRNMPWIIVRADFSDTQGEELEAQRKHWEQKHSFNSSRFVYVNYIKAGPHGSPLNIKYCYDAPDNSWMRIQGRLAELDWDEIFEQAQIDTSFPG